MSIYGENSRFKLIRCASDDDWREQRTKGIGGSDVAALMGLSPWKTPLQLWLEKTGREQPEDISERPYVAFGTTMEPVIGAWYKKEHPAMQVRRVNAIAQAIDRPWAQASLDYEIRDYASQTWGVLEIKTARNAKDWQDGVPLYYQTQVIHYLSVTGREYAHVAVFFRDTCEYQVFLIRPDKRDLKAVTDAVDTFWHDYVEKDVMPAVQHQDVATLADMYQDTTGAIEPADDPDTLDGLILSYRAAGESEKQAKEHKATYAAKIMELIGDAKGLETPRFTVTSVRSKTQRLDTKRLKEEHPDIYAQYTTETFRNGGLRIKEQK